MLGRVRMCSGVHTVRKRVGMMDVWLCSWFFKFDVILATGDSGEVELHFGTPCGYVVRGAGGVGFDDVGLHGLVVHFLDFWKPHCRGRKSRGSMGFKTPCFVNLPHFR